MKETPKAMAATGREATSPRGTRTLIPVSVLAALVGFFAWYGGGWAADASIAACAVILVESGSAAAAWMLGAWGLGIALARTLGLRREAAIELCLGVALMLWLAHLMGIAGALRPTWGGLTAAWAPVVAGLLRAAPELRRPRAGAGFPRAPSAEAGATPRERAALALVPLVGAALLLVAACVPPGTLWRSEASQFDTLSYHLELPRAWMDAGRLWPSAENAYSWLPSYMEAAYLHMCVMTSRPGRDATFDGLAPASIHAAQLLHAFMALALAWVCARACRARHDDSAGAAGSWGESGPAAASTLVLLTPWALVAGSCAYNDVAACLMLGGSLVIAGRRDVPPRVRGAMVGLMIGVATGVKPTALLMAGVPAGLMLLWATPRRAWAGMIMVGCAAGLAALAPWLVRNAMACGNPVFPYGAALFGDGPWGPLEHARWRAGHHPDVGLSERLLLLLGERGLAHAQWWATPIVSALALAWCAGSKEGRRSHGALALGIAAQIGVWITIGHQQSRFLLPIVVPGAILAGSAWAALECWVLARTGARSGARAWLTAATVFLQVALAAGCVRVWMGENHGSPTRALVPGVEAITGDLLLRAWGSLKEEERRGALDAAGPQALVNMLTGRDSPLLMPGLRGARLYLLGDSTPLYFHTRLLWHTTWSASPLGELVRAGVTPDELAARLAEPAPRGPGVALVLVNFDELARLHADGWYDPDATRAAARLLVERAYRVLRVWPGPEGGSALVLLRDPSQGGAPAAPDPIASPG